MTVKGKQSEVGGDKPTEKSMSELDNLVSDVISPLSSGPKSTLPDKDKSLDKEEGLEQEQEEAETEDPESPEEEDLETSTEGKELEEDVVPASKHKKTLEKMQRRIDRLVAEREAAKLKEQSSAKTQEQKLNQLSARELDSLIENTTDAIEDAAADLRDVRRNDPDKTEELEKRLSELRDLRRNANKAVKEAPVRFQQLQLEHYKQMVEEVKDIDPEIADSSGDLFNTAVRVYQKMPSLHRSETGQAEALAIAAEYFLEKKTLSDGQERTSTLSKKVANLKRKTALDSKTRAGNQSEVSQKNLRKKAISGTYYDKLDYIQKSLVPDDFLSPQ